MTARAHVEDPALVLESWDKAPQREEPETDEERALAVQARAEVAAAPERVASDAILAMIDGRRTTEG